MDADRVRHDARSDHVEHELLQSEREDEHPEEDVGRSEERDRQHRHLGDDRAEEGDDHRESRENGQHTCEGNPQCDQDRERRHPVDHAEDERPADEAAEGAVRALTQQLCFAAELGGQRGDEPLPKPIAVDEHDERDDQDERGVEEDVRRRRDVAERVGRDRARDLGELRRDLAVQIGHVDRHSGPLQAVLQSDDLLRGPVTVLGSAQDEVVQLTHETRNDECERSRENERDPDVHDHHAERAIEERPLVDASHKG